MKKIFFSIIISVFILSCGTNKNKSTKGFSKEYKPSILEHITGIELTANFAECGEWGGHKETFEIFRDDNYSSFALFTKDSVDCSKIDDKNREIKETKIIKLTKKNEILISKYLSKLLKSRLKTFNISNGGSNYTAVMKDSTMILKYYHGLGNWKEFEKLRNELKKENSK